MHQERNRTLKTVVRKRLVNRFQHFQLCFPVQTVPTFHLTNKYVIKAHLVVLFIYPLLTVNITSIVVVPALNIVSKRCRNNSLNSRLLLRRVCLTVKLIPPPAA